MVFDEPETRPNQPSGRVRSTRAAQGHVLHEMKRCTTILLTILCGTAYAAQLDLAENRSDNLTRLAEFLPIGTPMTNAVEKMKGEGFACHVYRNCDVPLMKGTTPIGHTGELDFIWCEKPLSKDSTRRQNAVLILDDSNCVKYHSLTTGNREHGLQDKGLEATGDPLLGSAAPQP